MSQNYEPIRKIPEHLAEHVVEQDPSLYTAIDHAAWRHIMKLSKHFYGLYAHQKYLDGLNETGISTERIPLLTEMDQKLGQFGWRAVGVTGFIPPSVFLEFQSLGILPIACDMRKIENIAYTPSPDIVHEAAGHAPIIADPGFNAYLRAYGEVARKAIFSEEDIALYNAIRKLSDVKEDPHSSEEDIQQAEKELKETTASQSYVSEASQVARMGWWTTEYGLIDTPDGLRLYGAGHLSSVSEGYNALGPEIKKIPLSLDCINTTYDITRPQPQVFVTPSFEKLTEVLEELADTMAFRRGGMDGIAKAKRGGTVNTIVLDSGIQISGKLVDMRSDQFGQPAYLSFNGPCQLAYGDKELKDQGPKYHKEGFGSPVGYLKGKHLSPADLNQGDLETLGFKNGKRSKLEFESGVKVEGVIDRTIQEKNKNIIIVFKDCTVTHGVETLFKPEWGLYDMACGGKAISVFGGAADRASYLKATTGIKPAQQKAKTNFKPEDKELIELYAQIREIRESGQPNSTSLKVLENIFEKLDNQYPDDWLLRFELVEISRLYQLKAKWEHDCLLRLEQIGNQSEVKKDMIERGFIALRAELEKK